MKNLQTGVDKRLLWKMTNRHSYYNKEILWRWQLFQRTDNVRESVNLRNIDPQMTLNLIVIYISYYFQEKHFGVFKALLSVAVPVYFIK